MQLVVHSIAVLSAVQMSDVTQYVDDCGPIGSYNYRIPIYHERKRSIVYRAN